MSHAAADRYAWTEPAVEDLGGGVYRIPLPLPLDGLKAVNVYAITDPGGVDLIDAGMAIVSGKVQLAVDSGEDAQPGFVMYLPVYARGEPQDTVAQRRAHLLGWVSASFRMRDVIASLYGEQPAGLSLTIYDGVQPSAAALLYHASGAKGQHPDSTVSASEYLVVNGHNWMLSMTAHNDFKARFGRNAETLIACTGTGLSLLLALLA